MDKSRKLVLRKHTIRTLTNEALGRVVGGLEPAERGFIMKDTVIVRTSNLVPGGPVEGP